MSTSAEQFALVGAVFLLLGAAFVFAPQIVNGVNSFLAAVFRRPRREQKAQKPAPAAPVVHAGSQGQAEPSAAAAPAAVEGESAEPWAPEPQPPPGRPGSAVHRLRQEISGSWGRREGA